MVSVELEEEERQMVLLALAQLSLINPGFDYMLNLIALKMDNEDEDRAVMYDSFRQCRREEPKWGVWESRRGERWLTHEVPWTGTYRGAEEKALEQDTKDRWYYEARRFP